MLLALVATACQSASISDPVTAPAGEILISSDLPHLAGGGRSAPTWSSWSITAYSGDVLPFQRAIQLAVDQHPTIGRFKLAYWSLDHALAGAPFADKAAQNVERMIAEPRVLGMIGPYTSHIAVGTIPIANRAGLVMISPTNTDACLTLVVPSCGSKAADLRPSGQNNYFRIVPPDPLQGRAMARFAADSLGVKWAAAFNEVGDSGDLIIDSFADELARKGGGLVLRQNMDMGTTNFTTFLTEAKKKGATAIYAVGNDKACTARTQMNPGVWFLATDWLTGDPDCVKDALANAADMYGTYSDVDPAYIADPAAQKVVADYRQAYPNTRISDYTFASYDCARILIDAIQRVVTANQGKFPTRAQVLDAVAHTQLSGVTGTYSFDSSGDAISPLMSLYQVHNGEWLYQKKIEAGP